MQEIQFVLDYILILAFITLYGTVTWSLIRYSTRESYRYWAVGWVVYTVGALQGVFMPSEGLVLTDAFSLVVMFIGSTIILDGSKCNKLTMRRAPVYLVGSIILVAYLIVGILLRIPFYVVFGFLGLYISYVFLLSAKTVYEIKESMGQPKLWLISGFTTWGVSWLLILTVGFIPEMYSIFIIVQAVGVLVSGASMLTLFMRTVTRDLERQYQVTQIMSSIVQHDIRNYIQVARLALDLTDNVEFMNGHLINVASDSLNEAKEFVDDMRDVAARLTRFEPSPQPQRFLTLVNPIKNRVVQEYSLSSEQVHVKIGEDTIISTCRLSKELLWNISDNAFKHSSDVLYIEEMESNTSETKLEISDRGGGISEKIKTFLNNPDSLSEPIAPGLGLGIVLIRGLSLMCRVQLYVDDVIEDSSIVGTKYTLIFRTAK